MGFSIVKAEDRTQRMSDWFAGICKTITDFWPGSVTRSKFETVAIELEAQDFAFLQAIKRCVPTAIYQAFSWPLLPATNATVLLTFSVLVAPGSNVTIPSGIMVSNTATDSTPAQNYTTTGTVTLLAGTTSITALAVCSVAGMVGNTEPNTIININTPVIGIDTVTNTAIVTNGQDRETEESRRIRFLEYVATLTRGTEAALVYGAKQTKLLSGETVTESVIDAVVTGPPDGEPGGQCNLYIWNGVGDASNNLITETAKIINGYTENTTKVPGYKAAGVVVAIASVITTEISVTASIAVRYGCDPTTVLAAAEMAVIAYIQSLFVGANLVHSALTAAMMEVEGVSAVYIDTPIGDVISLPNEIYLPTTSNLTVRTT